MDVSGPKVLIVDDQPELLKTFSKILRRQNLDVLAISSGDEALKQLDDVIVGVALISMGLADWNGPKLIKEMLKKHPEIVCIALAGKSNARDTLTALEAGALDYFIRPITDWPRFFHLIRQSMNVWERSCELSLLRKRVQNFQELRDQTGFFNIKGSSASVQVMMDMVRLVAPLQLSTLIFGESGVGKELVARAIHRESPLKNGPFVAVNCAAIQPELFESELFGHEKGAFTGAHVRREGLCAAAENGVLFLDEIGDLPLTLQPKLLRLLEQQVYRPVGGNRFYQFKARVIAATNVDLELAVTEKKFRQDLYFRISAQEIYVPPLRERKQDIQLLAYHFIEKYNQLCNRKIEQIHPQALRVLEEYTWEQNNVRELEREILRAMVRAANGKVILPEMLFWNQKNKSISRPSKAESPFADLLQQPFSQAVNEVRRRFTRTYVEKKLDESGGNKAKAASLAGMKASNFHRLIKSLDSDS